MQAILRLTHHEKKQIKTPPPEPVPDSSGFDCATCQHHHPRHPSFIYLRLCEDHTCPPPQQAPTRGRRRHPGPSCYHLCSYYIRRYIPTSMPTYLIHLHLPALRGALARSLTHSLAACLPAYIFGLLTAPPPPPFQQDFMTAVSLQCKIKNHHPEWSNVSFSNRSPPLYPVDQ